MKFSTRSDRSWTSRTACVFASFPNVFVVWLVHSKPMWTDIDLLSVSVNGGEEQSVTINGKVFSMDKCTAALELILLSAEPFNRVHIAVASNCRDLSWMDMCLNRFENTQPAKHVAELSFNGPPRSAPMVFERLLARDGTEQTVRIEFQNDDAWTPPMDHSTASINAVWEQLGWCSGLTSLHMTSQIDWTFDAGIRALAEKPPLNLKVLSLQLPNPYPTATYYSCYYQTGQLDAIAAIANACPALTQLHCVGRTRSFLLDLLSSDTLSRLEHFDIALSPEWVDPQTLGSLPDKLVSLNHSVITLAQGVRLTVIIPVVKSFLTAWHLEENTKLIYFDFEGFREQDKSPLPPHPMSLNALKRFSDSIVMLENGRIGFVKGSAVLACKFM